MLSFQVMNVKEWTHPILHNKIDHYTNNRNRGIYDMKLQKKNHYFGVLYTLAIHFITTAEIPESERSGILFIFSSNHPFIILLSCSQTFARRKITERLNFQRYFSKGQIHKGKVRCKQHSC